MGFLRNLELYNSYYRIIFNNRNSRFYKHLRVAYNKCALDDIEKVAQYLIKTNQEMKELLQILKK